MRVRPIISAAAVALVRLGLRMVFPRASAPARPGRRVSGSPASQASGRANPGPSTVTPRKHVPAPAAVRAMPAPVNRPASTMMMPAMVSARPAAMRRADNAAGPDAASRSAWIGATLVARQAGARPAMTVITRPEPNATASCAGGTASPVTGSDTPNPASRAARPLDSRMPSPVPARAATTPTSAASVRTERKTCPRPAPSARSSASSLVRCPIMIEKVFQITKAPTNSATPAKPRKK